MRHFRHQVGRHVLAEQLVHVRAAAGLEEIAEHHVDHVQPGQREHGGGHGQHVQLHVPQVGVHPDRGGHHHEREQGGEHCRQHGQQERRDHPKHADRDQLGGAGVGRRPAELVRQDARQHVGVDFDPGIDGSERRRAQVLQARRGGPDDDDGIVQQRGVLDLAVDDVGGGNVVETAGRAAIGNQHRALGVDRDAAPGQFQGFQRRVAFQQHWRFHEHRQRNVVQVGGGHGQRQGLVGAVLVLVQQRGAPHDAILVDQGVADESRAVGAGHQLRRVGAEPGGAGQEDVLGHGLVEVECGQRQLPRLEFGSLVGVEVVGHHGRTRHEPLGEHVVTVELRLELLETVKEHPVPVRASQFPQFFQVDAQVPLRKHHVPAHDHGAVGEQVAHHLAQLVPGPGPVPLDLEALLVQGHDHDARVLAALGGQADARIVHLAFEVIHKGDLDAVQDMRAQETHQQEGKRQADQVTFQKRTPRGSIATSAV